MCVCVFVFTYVSVCTFVYLCRGYRSRSNVLFSSLFAYLYFESGPSHLDILAACEPQESPGVQLPSVSISREWGQAWLFPWVLERGDLPFSCFKTAPRSFLSVTYLVWQCTYLASMPLCNSLWIMKDSTTSVQKCIVSMRQNRRDKLRTCLVLEEHSVPTRTIAGREICSFHLFMGIFLSRENPLICVWLVLWGGSWRTLTFVFLCLSNNTGQWWKAGFLLGSLLGRWYHAIEILLCSYWLRASPLIPPSFPSSGPLCSYVGSTLRGLFIKTILN